MVVAAPSRPDRTSEITPVPHHLHISVSTPPPTRPPARPPTHPLRYDVSLAASSQADVTLRFTGALGICLATAEVKACCQEEADS